MAVESSETDSIAGKARRPAIRYAKIAEGPAFAAAKLGRKNNPALIVPPVLITNTWPRPRDLLRLEGELSLLPMRNLNKI